MAEAQSEAVLVLAYGGPESMEQVDPFLERIFAGRRLLPETLRKGRDRYTSIGGKSPIMDEMRRFAGALRAARPGLAAYCACLYCAPFVEDVLRRIADDGHRSVLVLIASPFSCGAVRSRYTERLDAAAASVPGLRLRLAPPFFCHPNWVRAQADGLLSQLARARLAQLRWDRPDEDFDPVILFTAHSLPIAVSDSYVEELTKSFHAILEKAQLGGLRGHLAYQSRSGPASAWLGPEICETLARECAGHPARKCCVAVPFGFFFENMETVCDLDMDLKNEADRLGMKLFRAPAAGLSPFVTQMALSFLDPPAAGDQPTSPRLRTCP